MAGDESLEGRRRKDWMLGGGIVVALVLGVLAVVALVALVVGVAVTLIRGKEAGPDAGEMAEDPLLNIELDNAETRYQRSTQGREGGISLWPDQEEEPESKAGRIWVVDRAEGEAMLADVVGAASDLGVTFWSLRCSPGSTGYDYTYRGAKEVDVGDETIVAEVTIALDIEPESWGDDDPPVAGKDDLLIWLASDGTLDSTEPPTRASEPISGDCPDELVDAFNATQ